MSSTARFGRKVPFYILFVTCGLIHLLLFLKTIGNHQSTVCPAYVGKVPTVKETHISSVIQKSEKPILLIWLWPQHVKLFEKDCMTYFNIDSCVLTYDRSLYNVADGVLFFHKSIAWDLSNLPKDPRPAFQKWVWFNIESPTNTARKAGLENLFNLTLTYRRDLDISARHELSIVKSPEQFVCPQKNKIVCWIASNSIRISGTTVRLNYYNELRKHIDVNVYGRAVSGASSLSDEDYYSTIASCKFYLAFENSMHIDYITEKLNGPMVAGTVPIVLGPSRENYEQFIPADSFIHVDDFSDPKALAEYLLQLTQNKDMYMRYFAWRQYFKATPHLLPPWPKQPICAACDHIAKDNTFNVVHDLFWWFHKNVKGNQLK
ncbi:4-galactosyl-N-acetylglucosaminide 3-alpha-L-fucosyltransferase 9-like [Clupea harengus]|uniref:Fucosyltransferase n=1 Tax=Clupea harengus TaxID=7950 RepID=A0A6P3VL62_CLUHA|nr:4-galactosyl-N-acetylglucosaminide 3-alpha-L-fucosyltransferase 9-like [Clupea harengus]